MRGDELVPAVSSAEANDDLPAATNDLRGDIHEGLSEALPLPAHDLRGKGELGDPLAEMPSAPS